MENTHGFKCLCAFHHFFPLFHHSTDIDTTSDNSFKASNRNSASTNLNPASARYKTWRNKGTLRHRSRAGSKTSRDSSTARGTESSGTEGARSAS
jgi:hypothetical protein